jgi:glycosyltransferase involved in cell wall biosynthesis
VTPADLVDVTFVLPGLVASGGVRAVFEIADHLRRAGRTTAIVVPRRSLLSARRSPAGVAEGLLPVAALPVLQRVAPKKPVSQDWFDLQTPVIAAGHLLYRDVPRSKAVVATSYRTAEELLRRPEIRDNGVYFIQHNESWSGPPRRVDATWRAFDRIITSSEWLRRRAQQQFAKQNVGLAVYGVDAQTMHPSASAPEPNSADLRVVGFMWDDRPWKGGADLRTALELLRSRGFEFDAKAYGLASSPPPEGVAFAGRLTGEVLAEFYRSIDVFVSASHSESGPMTIPEAMSCGVPVVATDVGSVRLWSANGAACSIVSTKNPDGLARAIGDLMTSSELRAERSAAGVKAIAPFTWERTARAFDASLVAFGLLEALPEGAWS